VEQIFKDFLEAISPALQTLIVTLVTVLLGQLSAYLNKKYQIAKAQLSSDQQYFLEFLVSRAVDTVEQLYKADPAQQKLNAAINIINEALTKAGIVIDERIIVAAIEAQVFTKNANARVLSAARSAAPKG
jgi:LL-H family phage holin